MNNELVERCEIVGIIKNIKSDNGKFIVGMVSESEKTCFWMVVKDPKIGKKMEELPKGRVLRVQTVGRWKKVARGRWEHQGLEIESVELA